MKCLEALELTAPCISAYCPCFKDKAMSEEGEEANAHNIVLK